MACFWQYLFHERFIECKSKEFPMRIVQIISLVSISLPLFFGVALAESRNGKVVDISNDKAKRLSDFAFKGAIFKKDLVPIAHLKRRSGKDAIDVPIYYRANGCMIHGWWNDNNEVIPDKSEMRVSNLSSTISSEKDSKGNPVLFWNLSMIPERIATKDSNAVGPQYFKYVLCKIENMNVTVEEIEKRLGDVLEINPVKSPKKTGSYQEQKTEDVADAGSAPAA